MIVRRHTGADTESEAVYSPCEAYRYALTRTWATGPRLLYVMLNPSTATEARNDPTIERCERRARMLGFGAFRVANLFAFRATRPATLLAAPDPVGAGNDAALVEAAGWADRILCAWGAQGAHLGRAEAAERLLRAAGRPLLHLGLTRDGHPRHPLYVGYGQRPLPWD